MVDIIDYSPGNKSYIKSLNYEWLQKYFSVEPIDEQQLSNPEEEIIKKGGLIFYARYNDEIIGTATLLYIEKELYELGKMAITEKHQGKGIGKILLEHCIQKAEQLGAKKIILFSNTKLVPAIGLYKKYGFYEVDQGTSHYVRSNIKMEKLL